MTKPIVAILMGGPDSEREVSIRSGHAILNALGQSTMIEVLPLVIDECSTETLRSLNADVFFPVLHGPYGEGGPLQECLEDSGIPFVGSASKPARIAMDKHSSKKLAEEHGVPTPKWKFISSASDLTLELPFVLKPVDEGSSVGLAICTTKDEANTAMNTLLCDKPYIAEQFVKGHEITISILDGKPLSIIEIIPPQDIGTYDFEAKYQRTDTKYVLNPELPEHDCIQHALAMYDALELRDLARIDFIVNDDKQWFLEANTMPGFTESSLFPMAAADCGLSMTALCERLIQLALARG